MSKPNRKSTAEEVSAGVDLAGKTAIVTGANAGIGLETARVLALRGARVVMACRDIGKATKARKTIVRESEGALSPESFELRELDLASLASIRSFASDLKDENRPIHLLLNNAGVMLPDRRETSDGFEAHYGTNHLGHFLLTNLLLDPLRAAGSARVVNVASEAMQMSGLTTELDDLNWERKKWSGWKAYGSSKLMNLMFTRTFQRRYAAEGITSNALHPGIVRTELARSQSGPFIVLGLFMWPWMKKVGGGAATSVYAATAPEYAETGGEYLADCKPTRAPKLAAKESVQDRLWEISAEATGLGS
ncbi:MAG: SDR family oxidoreductase [Candidatus Binatia bacterium]|nr:SDR family oxidoreductase [Candidatus Binatia bacterium]